MQSPIFIVGANRSGTTLLRLILNAHSRIAIPDELIYWNTYMAGKRVETWRNPDLSTIAYTRFVQDFLEKRSDSLPGIDVATLEQRILQSEQKDLREPYRLTLEAWVQHHGKKRWGEKTPGNLFFADVLYEMFPSARFIYMVRDPRAGVASMQRVKLFPDDVIFNALNRRKHATTGRQILETNVPANQRTTVRYEDLVATPEPVVQRLCDFLQEPYEPEMLRFHRNAEQYMTPEASDSHNAAATRPISKKQAEKWRTELSNTDVACIEWICQNEMEAFGYETTGAPIPVGRWPEVLIKQLYWTLQCWRHADIRQYTVKYPMLAGMRRRLGW